MPSVWLVPLIAQLLAPLGLLAWLAFGSGCSRAACFAKAALVACYLVAAVIAGLWPIHPYYPISFYIVLFLLALAPATRRIRSSMIWPSSSRGWFNVGLQGALATLFLGVVLHAFCGWRPPHGPMIDLAFPLKNGTYYVANGGSNELINAHLMTLTGERFRPYRG